MKKTLIIIFTIVLALNGYSQISFEKGYYINNDGEKINCLIKNIDWRDNPTEIEYKLSENSKSEKQTIEFIKEFGINNFSKFIRYNVDIDRSSEDVNKLSNVKEPEFKKETLFLKVLIEGDCSLYEYVDNDLRRFFYSNKDGNVEQLIYKSYKVTQYKIAKNNRFKQQLFNSLKCSSFKSSRFENLEYKKKDLVRLFSDYSKCNDQDINNFELKQKRDLFNLNIRPRLNSSSLKIRNSGGNNDADINYDNEIGIGFGIEAEFILPYNRNKWSVFVEPTYQSYKTEKEKQVNFEPFGDIVLDSKVDYSSIEIPVGVRHYFFLNSNSKVFINAAYVFDVNFKSSITIDGAESSSLAQDLEIKSRNNFAFGLGYKFEDRYSVEFRLQTSREILSDYVYRNSDYTQLSLVLGYSLF